MRSFHLNSPEVLELYRERTNGTISEIKTSGVVRSRYNDLKGATDVCDGRADLWDLNWKLFQ